MKTFEVRIRPAKGKLSQIVRVQARNHVEAKEQLEGQYGKGCVLSPYKEIQESRESKHSKPKRSSSQKRIDSPKQPGWISRLINFFFVDKKNAKLLP